jgi:hypothetical protein
MRLPRIRLVKSPRGEIAGAPASADGNVAVGDIAIVGVADAVLADPGGPMEQVTEPPLPRRQPNPPRIRVDRTPVDAAVLRRVLDALNEAQPLTRALYRRSAVPNWHGSGRQSGRLIAIGAERYLACQKPVLSVDRDGEQFPGAAILRAAAQVDQDA